jgi:YgiT-type zinc finger domain-containing protein
MSIAGKIAAKLLRKLIDDQCPKCGKSSMIHKSGEFTFDPPTGAVGVPIIVPNAEWFECEDCGEKILSYSVLQRIHKRRR